MSSRNKHRGFAHASAGAEALEVPSDTLLGITGCNAFQGKHGKHRLGFPSVRSDGLRAGNGRLVWVSWSHGGV